jgi:hypothetical protein
MPDSHKKDKVEIIQCTWRPMLAHVYMAICIFDFVIMPILQNYLNAKFGTVHYHSPLTLKEAGMFHLAFGAILGASAWTRGKEKIEQIEHTESNDYRGYDNNMNNTYTSGNRWYRHHG